MGMRSQAVISDLDSARNLAPSCPTLLSVTRQRRCHLHRRRASDGRRMTLRRISMQGIQVEDLMAASLWLKLFLLMTGERIFGSKTCNREQHLPASSSSSSKNGTGCKNKNRHG